MGGRAEFDEARELLGLLNNEIKRGFDQGLSEEDTAKQVEVGKFSNFLGQDRVGLITHMAYLAYRDELE